MTVQQAREAARRWIAAEASRIPGFEAAYTAGSTNWLPDHAGLPAASDLDIMVVLSGPPHATGRGKFLYDGALLEVSWLRDDQLRSPDQVLADYHLAPSLATARILLDPSGRLTALQRAVSRDYARRSWVRRRCAQARDKVLASLHPIGGEVPLHDQVIACLFGAGIAAHVLLVAGLRNPTVRTRYVAARDLLADCARLDFHETLLALLGAARIGPDLAARHVAALRDTFDAAADAMRSPFAFAPDLAAATRPIAIDGSLDLIARGLHREAMFWIAVTHSRCRKVLAADAPAELPRFDGPYRELLADLGLATPAALRQRRTEIERALPAVWALAEAIVAANPEIEGAG